MPDPTLSQAIREAYASVPADVIDLHTLELRHPDFTAPIRVVRNFQDTAMWLTLGGAEVQAVLDALDDDVRDKVGLVARLEADAPVDAGVMVPFIALAFDFELPPVDTIPVPEITLTMDNVGREISDALDAAAISQEKVQVTYRPYLSTDIEGPQMDPPMTMDLTVGDVSPLRAIGKARVLDIGNRAFPNVKYTIDRFPGLGWQ